MGSSMGYLCEDCSLAVRRRAGDLQPHGAVGEDAADVLRLNRHHGLVIRQIVESQEATRGGVTGPRVDGHHAHPRGGR